VTIPAIAPTAALPGPATIGRAALDDQAATAGTGFGQALADGLGQLQQAQAKSDNLAVSAATGDLTDIHDYMIASAEASLATQLTAAVRNKAVDAFSEIMRMQA
jgi:flagellar hook-basal body complex protein FliE